MKNLLSVLFVLLVHNLLYAQTKVWDKRFGGEEFNFCRYMIGTPDGGVLMGGESSSPKSLDKTEPNVGQLDLWIVKVDSLGKKQWDKTLGGSGIDNFSYMINIPSGGYLVASTTISPFAGGTISQPSIGGADVWIAKIDNNGAVVWEKRIGGTKNDRIVSITPTTDDGFVLVCGTESTDGDVTSSNPTMETRTWIVKIDANGNKIWDKMVTTGIRYAINTTDGGTVFAGTISREIADVHPPVSKGGNDFKIFKLDVSGNLLWDKHYGGTDDDDLGTIIQLSDGSFVLGGTSVSGACGDKTEISRGLTDYWLLKVDSNGNKIWDKTFGGSSDDTFKTVISASNGGLLIGGTSGSDIGGDKTENSRGGLDYWVVRVDDNGNKAWDKRFGIGLPLSLPQNGDGDDKLTGLANTPNNGFFIGGASYLSPSAFTNINAGDVSQKPKGYGGDYWAVKINDVVAINPCSQTACIPVSVKIIHIK